MKEARCAEYRDWSAYAALAELGKACKTAFLCRNLRDEQLRRETHEGLNARPMASSSSAAAAKSRRTASMTIRRRRF